mmetsp:Transcript_15337/g.25925  ORF Transcript_15337/g.25925 Transcript_15337/m.25925 type:complete len:98 (-) Transcript_15337:46-339(-)
MDRYQSHDRAYEDFSYVLFAVICRDAGSADGPNIDFSGMGVYYYLKTEEQTDEEGKEQQWQYFNPENQIASKVVAEQMVLTQESNCELLFYKKIYHR